ncbi:MAG: T9SS type A sorting domain-containing protein [Bacteroidota bacterium]|nr:T9SS type A sorting domain-containing protein [Bacteroidota bacterium]
MKTFAPINRFGMAVLLFLFVYSCFAQQKSISNNGRTNDIALDSTYISFQAWYTTGYSDDGFYSNRPVNQIMPVSFCGRVSNIGNATQNNVSFNVKIHDNTGWLLYSDSDTITSLQVNSWYNFYPSNSFTPAGQDKHIVSMFCDQNEADANPANNEADTVSFNITQTKLIARHRFYNDNFSPAEYTGGTDGDFAGLNFYIPNHDTIYSMSVFIDSITDAGTIITGSLLNYSGGTPMIQIETAEHYIQQSDIGNWVTMNFITINPGEDLLEGGQKYTVAVWFYFGTSNLYIGTDTLGPHNYPVEAVYFAGGDTIPLEEIPMIKANMVSNNPSQINQNQNSNFNIFKIFPNPVNNKLFIKSNLSSAKISEVKIFSILGKEENIDVSNGENNISIDTDMLPAGIYILKFTVDGREYVRKIVRK